MRRFSDCTWMEAAEAVLAMTSRLTVLKSTAVDGPVLQLCRCMRSLLQGDVRGASDACFDMTAELLSCGCRRVSGDLWRDYLLHRLLIEPDPFAEMAAANRLDEALYNAMRADMGILYELASLDSASLYRCVKERYKELKTKGRPGVDDTTRYAAAAWGGAALRPRSDDIMVLPAIPAMLPEAGPVWHYGEEELRGSYVADEALEEMYHRLLDEGMDWSGMVEDIWNFFASYGTGDFIKYRMFMWRGASLEPMREVRQEHVQPLMEGEYKQCLDHVIAFMRGDSAEPLLITGAAGMGKTTMLFSLADELPELRFVYVPDCRSVTQLAPLFDMLSRQPVKFMVALDDCELRDFAVRAIPVNVLLTVADVPRQRGRGMFSECVNLDRPQLDGFASIVQKLLDAEGVQLPRDVVRSACVDRQVDTKGELTCAAAVAVAAALCRRLR